YVSAAVMVPAFGTDEEQSNRQQTRTKLSLRNFEKRSCICGDAFAMQGKVILKRIDEGLLFLFHGSVRR
ncbi:MAG: hypothetical protein RSC00_06940, partial [Ruthenibacterium sp.]